MPKKSTQKLLSDSPTDLVFDKKSNSYIVAPDQSFTQVAKSSTQVASSSPSVTKTKQPNSDIFKPAQVVKSLGNAAKSIVFENLIKVVPTRFPESEITIDGVKQGFLKGTQVYLKETAGKEEILSLKNAEFIDNIVKKSEKIGKITDEILNNISDYVSTTIGATSWRQIEEKISNPKLDKLVNEHYYRLKETISDHRYGNTYDLFWQKEPILNQQANEMYSQIRDLCQDIEIISKNTGIEKEVITQVKSHVFYETHRVCGNVMKFAPDIDMANAWTRLLENKFVQSDIRLIVHEYTESLIMEGDKVDWRIAHQVASSVSNWLNHL